MRAVLALAVVWLVTAPPPAAAPPTATRSSQTPAKTATPGPPIEWLKDEEGRQYRLEPLAKHLGQKVSPTRVRTMWGVQADLGREDEKFIYIKIYRVDGKPAPPLPGAVAAAPSARPRRPPAEPLPATRQTLRWTPDSAGLPTAGQWREGLALVDVTGDGRLDIAVSPARKSLRPPSVFVNIGKSWSRASTFSWPQRPYDYGDLAAGDVNHDGTPDLVLGIHLRGLIALRSTARMSYEDGSAGLPFATRSGDPVFSTRALALADCNADGRLDVLALGEGPRLPAPGVGGGDLNVATGIASFVQAADGSWTPKARTERGAVFGSSLASGDVDGDGTIDLVIAPGTMGDTRLLHRGDGACGWQPESVGVVRPRSYLTAVAAADVNRDGRAEVIVGYTDFAWEPASFGVDLLARGRDGVWTRRALMRESGRGRVEAITSGDLNGDGHPDVAVADGDGDVRAFLGDGRGTFTRERQTLSSTARCAGGSIAIGDLNGDGLGDLVVGFAREASPAAPDVCPREGAIVAWTTRRASAARPRQSSAPAGRSRRK